MTHIHTLTRSTAAEEPHPRRVQDMAMVMLGFAFGAASSPTRPERRDDR